MYADIGWFSLSHVVVPIHYLALKAIVHSATLLRTTFDDNFVVSCLIQSCRSTSCMKHLAVIRHALYSSQLVV